MKVEDFLLEIFSVKKKYELTLLYFDYTDNTLICRLGLDSEIFIQIYVNVRKEKLNLALIIKDFRIYGVDKEGGFYHEHPVKNPTLHLPIVDL